MSEQPLDRDERDYEETVAPSNPPNAVLRPAVRRTAVWTYLGLLVLFFLVVGGALTYFAVTGRGLSPDGDERTDPSAVGTSGDRIRANTAGGHDPTPQADSTRSELEFRGAGEPSRGPLPGLRGLRNESPDRIQGRRIELDNVVVERTDGTMFWVRDGDDRGAVMTAGGTPTVRAGQHVDVSGTIERDGNDVRIRATRIDVR
jgi:hypothetical protein